MRASRFIPALLLSYIVISASAQTKLKLSAIQPGTEIVQLITNGDFQQQGTLVGTNHPNPTGWSRVGEIFADAGTNMVVANNGVVARANTTTAAGVSLYSRSLTLERSEEHTSE